MLGILTEVFHGRHFSLQTNMGQKSTVTVVTRLWATQLASIPVRGSLSLGSIQPVIQWLF